MPQGQTLAQMVRAKYPGVYDDLSDTDLESKVTAKYPGVYDDVPKSAAGQPERGVLDRALEVGKGMGKSVLGVVEAGGNLIRKIPGVQALEDATGAYVDTGIDTRALNTPQTVGKVIGDIGTAFVPAGGVTKLAKGASALLPTATSLVGRMATGAARSLVRGAVEAAGAGAIGAAQGYDPTASAVTGGVLGTVTGAAAGIASKLKRGAQDSMIAALGPAGRGTGPAGTNQVEMAKKLAPGLLQRNFRALTHEEAIAKAGDAIDTASQKMDDIMAALPAGTRVRTQPIIETLQVAKRQGQVKGVPVGTGKIANELIDSVIDDLKQIGPSMTPEEAIRFRQRIGPLAKWSNLVAPAENVKAETYKDVYNGIRSAIEGLDPGVRTANQEMSFWLNVRDLLERSSRRPQPPSSGTSGAVLGAITGQSGGPLGALGAAAVGRQLQRLMRSPGWRFMSANVKDDLADALMTRDLGRFNQLIAVASSQLGSAAQESQ